MDLIPNKDPNTITSPRYPETYPRDVTCTWYIYTTSGSTIKAIITDFNMETWPDNYDVLVVGIGDDLFNLNQTSYFLIEGTDSPASVTSPGNKMLLVLVAQALISFGRGFSVDLQAQSHPGNLVGID